MTDAGVTWTDERVELLKKLWTDGLSASQIAAELGNVTRNAVIGKVHRLGLSGRAKDAKAAAAAAAPPQGHPRAERSGSHRRRRRRSNVVIAPIPPQPMRAEPEVWSSTTTSPFPMSERVTIMDLRESMCRWPMGDPTKPEFRFCGARSDHGPALLHPSRPHRLPAGRPTASASGTAPRG